MNTIISIIVLSAGVLLLSCSDKNQSPLPVTVNETGTVQATVNLGEVGTLAKKAKTTDIDMTDLIITLFADGQSAVQDTLALDGGSQQRTERKLYSGLPAFTNGQSVEWMLLAKALDQNGNVIYSGDTAFTIPVGDTVNILLTLKARYSMLVADYYPIRDSVTRCALMVDGYMVTDSLFPKQTLIGDTIMLRYDYLRAISGEDTHTIQMNVYGDIGGHAMLLYTGDTTIVVRSGVDADYRVILDYVGPDTGALQMTVMLGNTGKVIIDGEITTKYHLTLTKEGQGMVHGSDSVFHGIARPITAIPESGYFFSGWQVREGKGTIADSLNNTTSIKLEHGDATVVAHFYKDTTTFEKEIGASFLRGRFVQQTSDGGFIVAGACNGGGCLVKITATGDTIWTRTYSQVKELYCVQQTTDEGYIINGYNSADTNMYLVKTDTSGTIQWTRTFHSDLDVGPNQVLQTSDGGYMTMVMNYSGKHSVFSSYLETFYRKFLIKTDANGDLLWTTGIMGEKMNTGSLQIGSFQQTRDGGIIVLAEEESLSPGWGFMPMTSLAKVNMDGDATWTNALIYTVHDYDEDYTATPGIDGYSVRQTNDGGYIITGDYSVPVGTGLMLYKTDAEGNYLWNKNFEGYSRGYSVQQTIDDGYIITGNTESFRSEYGRSHICIIKTDVNGDSVWTKKFREPEGGCGYSVQQLTNGGYIITGEVKGKMYLIKTDENGEVH